MQPLPPLRVLWKTAHGITNHRRLLAPEAQPVVSDPGCCRLRHAGDEPGVLLDFGLELHGRLRLVTAAFNPKRPLRVRVRFGESAGEAMGVPDQDHAIHQQELLVPWCGQVDVGPSGFRFARIDLIDPGATLDLRGIVALRDEPAPPRIGSFRCSDKRISRIWEVATRTVELCAQDLLWDGIKRDRLAWMGDLHPEIRVMAAVHGTGAAVVPRTLDFLRDTTPLPAWMNTIPTYSLWWIIAHRDWLQAGGDLAYARAQAGYLEPLLAQVVERVRPDGTYDLPGLVDWAIAGDRPAEAAGIRALLAWALQAGAELAKQIGRSRIAARASAAATRVARGGMPKPPCKQAAALAVLAGMCDARTANRQVLARQPARGLSPFLGYYVLEARAEAGDERGGLDLLRRYWGGMLDLGATTFWEHFDLDWLPAGRIDRLPGRGPDVHRDRGAHCFVGWRHSLCHGWSGGPSAWLLERVLGVRPLAPGYARVRVNPRLGGLAWAEGAVATPHGPIIVRAVAGRTPRIELPPGVALG